VSRVEYFFLRVLKINSVHFVSALMVFTIFGCLFVLRELKIKFLLSSLKARDPPQLSLAGNEFG
jgi:hypothetical protein